MVKPLGTMKEPSYLKMQHHQTFMFNGQLPDEDQQLLFHWKGQRPSLRKLYKEHEKNIKDF